MPSARKAAIEAALMAPPPPPSEGTSLTFTGATPMEITEEVIQEAKRGPSYLAARMFSVQRRINTSGPPPELPQEQFVTDVPANITALEL